MKNGDRIKTLLTRDKFFHEAGLSSTPANPEASSPIPPNNLQKN